MINSERLIKHKFLLRESVPIVPMLMSNKIMAFDEEDLQLMNGKRIHYNGEFGTVLFVGEVPPASGMWLGIEWDDPTRGKHDGLHEGVRYFQTKHPTSGSFVRLLKADFGRSFLTALKDRYREIKGDDTFGVDQSKLSQLQKEMNVRFIEVVGLDQVNKKQSCLSQIQVAGLRDQKISEAEPKGMIRQVCPSIKELDLSKNLISNWNTVAQIVSELPSLRFLNLSENKIELMEDAVSLSTSFESLEHIVLGKIDYTWENMMSCVEMWPNLCELQVPWNNMTSLGTPSASVALQSLDLEGNPIEDWEEVNKVGLIESLEVLNVSNTGIKKITFPGEKKTYLFPSLRRLILQENHIHEWTSVSELNKLPALKSLRLSQNPVVDQFDKKTTRQLVIARIGKITNLNGVEIEAIERKWSERDYIKGAMTIRLRMKIPEDKFLKMHPRYPELVEKHGEPEEGELMINQNTPLSTTLIDLEICSPDRPGMNIIKKLPKTMTIQRLKVLVNKLLNFDDPRSLVLSIKNPKYAMMEIPLDNDQKSLDYFSAGPGDVIVAQQISKR